MYNYTSVYNFTCVFVYTSYTINLSIIGRVHKSAVHTSGYDVAISGIFLHN